MTDKKIHQLFAALTPTTEQKKRMYQNIFVQSQVDKNRDSKCTPAQRRYRFAVPVALLLICFTTTAFAATYMGLEEAFFRFLNPVDHKQTQYLSSGAGTVGKQITNENGTLEIRQVIGDRNLTYLLLDFTAPDGTILDAARYRFEHVRISFDQPFYSTGFTVVDDGNTNDNTIRLIMCILTEDSLAGQTVAFTFEDLQAADPLPGIFETVIPGMWETEATLAFQDFSSLYQVDQEVNMFGYQATVKTIAISPISISLQVESEALKEISEAARGLEDIGEHEYLDRYPVTINFADGTSSTTSIFTGLTVSDHLRNQLLTIKTFENAINDKEIASVVFFHTKIPIADTSAQ